MKTVASILEIIAGIVICWWVMAIARMFILTVAKYLVWFWWAIN
ncbi:hypothetical protein [Loigolactobacillus zhaoyuanensis]|uniref:Uncharacterized protein n=1 Tax=Loigolactobacillus zhaoyuanensis TaxID=2486017 RepID=A0ABW8U9G1_9LACO